MTTKRALNTPQQLHSSPARKP